MLRGQCYWEKGSPFFPAGLSETCFHKENVAKNGWWAPHL